MSKLKQLSSFRSIIRLSSLNSRIIKLDESHFISPSHKLSQMTSTRFLDIYQMGNKEAIEKERARLKDEMNRGYFADIAELKQHGGKIEMANKIIIPAVAAMKFPAFEVTYSDGRTLKLPITTAANSATDSSNPAIPKASLLCLSFRAHSQAMVDTWTVPFLDAFRNSKDIQLFEVSFVESWFLSLKPIKWMLLRTMRKSNPEGKDDSLQRQVVYSFGDQYYFRKELKILNLLTGYIFLIDKFGRIRWQGFGQATMEELSSLMSCTSLLVGEK
ncbi:ATPase assembly factor ATP10 [Dillenia turbinata]|uniref:ATPase assembly factor ATP10 n=1 Tax=Dillenia turbinata TaxID=194707 RepID=A0AAN8VFT5_9MAGN